jgi:hypothetical protein
MGMNFVARISAGFYKKNHGLVNHGCHFGDMPDAASPCSFGVE